MSHQERESKKRKGIVFVLSILILVALGVLSVLVLTRGASESNFTRRFTSSTRAFWLAEAGINWALNKLQNNFDYFVKNGSPTFSGEGTCSVSITFQDANTREVVSTGSVSLGGVSIQHQIKAWVKKYIPSNFYNQPLYCAGNIDFNGSSYSVVAEDSSSSNPAIIYAGDFDVEHPENIIGTTTYSETASPLARFDFQQLYDISSSQGNVYNTDRLKKVKKGEVSFPSSFWYTRADDGIDNDNDDLIDESDEWVPNVVYVESDLQLNGNIGNVGGFFVVVGDVITDPDEVDDIVIDGSGTIEGVVYTLGEFRINGGGGNLNVNGGVWAGKKVRLNGSASIEYNRQYMDAIESLNIDPGVYIYSWEDLQKPYKL